VSEPRSKPDTSELAPAGSASYQPDPTGEKLRAAQEEVESREPTALERACYGGQLADPDARLSHAATAWGS